MSSQPAPARAPSDRRVSANPKRASILPKPSSIVCDASVVIAQHAQLTGVHPITIGTNAVLHPHAKISSAQAPVVLGEGCVIFEKARVGLGMSTETDADSRRSSMASFRNSFNFGDSSRGDGVVLGRNVVIESMAVIEAAEIGEGTVIEVGVVLGRGCTVGKYCTISTYSVIPPNAQIPDYTVVYSGTEHRLDKTLQIRPEAMDARLATHAKQLEMFKKLVPNHVAKWI